MWCFIQAGRVMDIKSYACAISGIFLLNLTQANAAVVFYTDIAAFNTDANTSIIDFEGIVADNEMSLPADSIRINDVIFTTDPLQFSAIIFGKYFNSPDTVTDSALFVANNGNNIIIDLSVAGVIKAAGGIFGDYNGPFGQQVTFNIYDSLGDLIDTQIVDYGDMRLGGEKTFFGWITNGVDEIVKIELLGNLDPDNDIRFSALDDFQYGTVVPVPAALWLFGSGLIGLIAVARRKS